MFRAEDDTRLPFAGSLPKSDYEALRLLSPLNDDLSGLALSWALRSDRQPAIRFLGGDFSADDPAPGPGEIVLALARPAARDHPEGCTIAALPASAEELDRTSRLRFPRDRWAHRSGHGLLRSLLGRILSIDPRDVQLRRGDHGKPFLDWRQHGSKPLHFSLSHTRDRIAVALARTPVGVDVEVVRPVPEMRALLCELGSADSIGQFDAALDDMARTRLFFRIWTLTEAFLKATGEGLGGSTRGLQFTASSNPKLIAGVPPEIGWHFGHRISNCLDWTVP